MLEPEPCLSAHFPPVDFDHWRELVEQGLSSASLSELLTTTYDGLTIRPLYHRADLPEGRDQSGLPGAEPFVRGAGQLGLARQRWDLRCEQTHPDPDVVCARAAEDIRGGATSLLLQLDVRAIVGEMIADQARDRGILVHAVEDLDRCLAEVDLEATPIHLDAGAGYQVAAVALASVWERRGLDPSLRRGGFGGDPLGALSRDGCLLEGVERSLASVAELALWTHERFSEVRGVAVDTSAYHLAGATSCDDLALAMASGLQYLRAMLDQGMDIDAAAQQIEFRMSIGTGLFRSTAKLRAARRLWSRIVGACGGSAGAQALQLHVRPAERALSRHEPWVNLLRNTVAGFAAAVGGAQAITPVAFDATLGEPGALGRRIARNTPLILTEEAHMTRAADPAGGSWYLEVLTDDLADRAWATFQEIERRGGMVEALRDDWVRERLAALSGVRERDIRHRRRSIIGVSEFAQVDQPGLSPEIPDRSAMRRALSGGLRAEAATHHQTARVRDSVREAGLPPTESLFKLVRGGTPLVQASAEVVRTSRPSRLRPLPTFPNAAPFERLRDRSDEILRRTGQRPRVLQLNLGPKAEYVARASWTRRLLATAGIEAVVRVIDQGEPSPVEIRDSGCRVALLCSSDSVYQQLATGAASALKKSGIRLVTLVGRPATEAGLRGAGVDDFIYVGSDVVAFLEGLLRELGAPS